MKTEYHNIKVEIPEKFLIHHPGLPLIERINNGSYEREEISMLNDTINEDSVILELGGSIGILSCISNSKLTNKSNHVVVEAHPHLISVIENNRGINGCEFKVYNGIASHNNKPIDFYFNEYPLNGNVFYDGGFGKSERIRFEGTTPQFLEEKFNLKFNTLMCDIEGGEFALLENLFEYFQNYNVLMVEFHNWGGGEPRRQKIEKMYSEYFTINRVLSTTKFTKK